MTTTDSGPDRLLIDRIRAGDEKAWHECIALYERRLIAFAESRLNNRAAAEDVVQEAFLGFLISLPNYDDRTPLESWLFSIAAHKLTDALRKTGRRPELPLFGGGSNADSQTDRREPPGDARKASSLMQSRERRTAESEVVANCLGELISGWKAQGEFERLKCLELLFVRGMKNKTVADRLGISEQAVANHKHFVVGKLKDAAANARLREFNVAALGIE